MARDRVDGGSEGETRVSVTARRDRMLAVIKEREFVRVGELSARFDISEVTVRNDLDALASHGEIRRIRGGAIPRSGAALERPFEETEASFAAQKVAIGQAAAQLVQNGETLLVDVGTTTVAAARALVARTELRDVVVFTNGLKTAFELEPAIGRFTVVVLGGTLRPLQHSLVEPLGSVVLEHINVNTVFLGCNGVDPVGGITNINLPEAEIKKRMLKTAERRVVLADGSKIGRVALAHLCPIHDVDLLITDESADAATIETLKEQGCEVLVVR
jgi:DeoR family transcriptional regulator of aga operon